MCPTSSHRPLETDDPRADMAPRKEMPLSCLRCRIRKVKCNFAHPCLSCVKLGVECIEIPNDMRKKRPRVTYVLTLEKQLGTMQEFVGALQKLDSADERAQYMEANMAAIATELGVGAASECAVLTEVAQHDEEPATQQDFASTSGSPNKNRPIYGPTSVYHNDEVDVRAATALRREIREVETLRALNRNPDVLHCLKLFFTWQYPDNSMFVFREAFLKEFFQPQCNSLYCLAVLVLSICALGARMSDVESVFRKAITYYNEARSCLLSSFERPPIASVQSFLLLAFYDIYSGHNSAGWMLLGNAIRMGYDLGFQLSPEVWFLRDCGPPRDMDRAIRSRIYWGCFMADHFISLVLGRPSLLKLLDASISQTEDLPELDWIDDYKYIPDTDTNISDPLKNIVNLINISDNMLNDVFTKTEPQTASHDDYVLGSRLLKLIQYNNEIQMWRNLLPLDLYWDQENLKLTGDNPTVSGMRYYYYILLLCLNRPFVGLTKEFKDLTHLSPGVICSRAIDDLYVAINRFQETHGLRRASIFIVYCSILSVSVILLRVTANQVGAKEKRLMKFFMSVLQRCSKTWGLAEKSYRLIRSKIEREFADDPDLAAEVAEKTCLKRARKFVPRPVPEVKLKHIEVPAEGFTKELREGHAEGEVARRGIRPPRPEFPLVQSSDDWMPVSDETAPQEYFNEDMAEFFGGPPVLMTLDLCNEDWEALFPDSIFNQRVGHLSEAAENGAVTK